jgi:hypothetical protein
MRYTVEKELAKAELDATAFHLFADLILSFISIDADEMYHAMVRYRGHPSFGFYQTCITSREVPDLIKYLSYEWNYVEQIQKSTFGKNTLVLIFGPLIRKDNATDFSAIFQNIHNTSLSSYSILNIKNITDIVLKNGKCEKILEVIRMQFSDDILLKYFEENFLSRYTRLFDIFINSNSQYGYL